MRQLAVLIATLALATLVAVMLVRTPSAQPELDVYDACRSDEERIVASDLPAVVEPGRCPFGGREIRDNGVGSTLPESGTGVSVEALTPTGAQELTIRRYRNGTVTLAHVGSETPETVRISPSGMDDAPRPCSDRAYVDTDVRLDSMISWYLKKESVPAELGRDVAERAIRDAGTNVADVRDGCGVEDRVTATLDYLGDTGSSADLDPDGTCNTNDGRSEVSFGDLPEHTPAAECKWFVLKSFGYDSLRVSDIKLNKRDFRWTTQPNAPSCEGRFDLEGIMTHERGHTFGLGHVAEAEHGRLTMSPVINGPCQDSERTLGRGDAIGLNAKYE